MLATLCFAHADSHEETTPSKTGPLFAGQLLPSADGLYTRWDARRSYANGPVIKTLAAVAERIAWELPSADPLLIGDISTYGGGQLDGHKTHDKGSDADIGLFMRGQRQPLGGFIDVRPDQLDVAATWQLVCALLDTGNVQFILLDQGHIDRLHAYALERGYDPSWLLEVFPPKGAHIPWDRRGVVHHAANHRSHLHVRITEPPEQRPVN